MPPLASQDVAVVTPWYPTREAPARGCFVESMVRATSGGTHRMRVYHLDTWVSRLSPAQHAAARRAPRRLRPHLAEPRPTAAGAALTYIPVLLPRGLWYADIAHRTAEALGEALDGNPIPEPVVHAHVGSPGGWAALRHLRPDARLVVTEHASFLPKVLADPPSRAMYAEVLDRCHQLFTVGAGLRDLLVAEFAEYADRIDVVPNPVTVDQTRPAPVAALKRWLCVGNLIALKRVDLIVEAFARCHAHDPELTLTCVGGGSLRDELAALARRLGVDAAVRFTGPLPHAEALAEMRDHDLLVHASGSETFGVVAVEAVLSGLPVLLTRCAGPAETLAGLADHVGELVDVDLTAEDLAAAYWRLRRRYPDTLDLPGAGAVLAERYRASRIAALHHQAWFAARPALAASGSGS